MFSRTHRNHSAHHSINLWHLPRACHCSSSARRKYFRKYLPHTCYLRNLCLPAPSALTQGSWMASIRAYSDTLEHFARRRPRVTNRRFYYYHPRLALMPWPITGLSWVVFSSSRREHPAAKKPNEASLSQAEPAINKDPMYDGLAWCMTGKHGQGKAA